MIVIVLLFASVIIYLGISEIDNGNHYLVDEASNEMDYLARNRYYWVGGCLILLGILFLLGKLK